MKEHLEARKKGSEQERCHSKVFWKVTPKQNLTLPPCFSLVETKNMGRGEHMLLIPTVVLYVGGEGSETGSYTLQPMLTWNLLCNPGWPHIHSNAASDS